jgi:hypothetical protein
MNARRILIVLAVALVGLTATVDAGPMPTSAYTCTPKARCYRQSDCGVHPATGQYLGICGASPYNICLCY